MLEHKEHFHGSDLEKIEKIYGIKKEDITSFSANVNPLGISPLLKEKLALNIDKITSYPDREYTALRQAIASYIKDDYNNITVGNGSTELISIIMQLMKPKHAILFAPSYSEYEHELSAAGGQYEYFFTKDEDNFVPDIDKFQSMLSDDIDLVVICNPNNPTSFALDINLMRRVVASCKQHNAIVMVDETYIEFAPIASHVESLALIHEFDNLIILRGISKFFAAPGLRLGYAISSNQELLSRINAKKNPWTINTLAAIAGEIMFTDTQYINNTKKLINDERIRIKTKLNAIKELKTYDSFGNFMLCKIMRDDITASDVFDAAIKKGLMIRNCSTFESLDEHYFRFCFMLPEKNDELFEVIKCTVTQHD